MRDCTERENWMSMILPARASNLGLARVSVASFAAQGGFTLTDIEEIKVAVSEAVSNVVLHAYPEGEGEVRICARLCGDELTVQISDRGVGIEDVSRAVEASHSTLQGRMGVGFSFMEAFMDETAVESVPGEGTRIVMRRRVSREDEESVTDSPPR
ncbi:MAG: anti-sigma F factor [Bacillota bacterium]